MLLDRKEDLIVMVDMINGFCFEGNMASPNIIKLIPKIETFIEDNLNNDVSILHYTDAHPIDAQEFKTYPVHCLIGSNESKVVSELDYPKIKIINKNSTNGFFAYNPLLEKKNIYLVGCVTDICIFEFALTLQKYKEEHNLPYTINIISDLVDTFDAPNHEPQEINKQYLDILKRRGVNIITEIAY